MLLQAGQLLISGRTSGETLFSLLFVQRDFYRAKR